MSDSPASRGLVALGATLSIQIYVSLAATAAAVLAPVIAPELGLSPKLVGVFVGLVYLGSTLASLAAGGLIARHGAIRLSQICVVVCALGLTLLPLASQLPMAGLLLVVAPLVIGAGYGPITPASSQVLARTAPPSRMALTFSIKQTGVPGGAALGGAVLPALALAVGWHATLLIVAALAVAVVIAAQPIRAELDRDRDLMRKGLSLAAIFAPVRTILADRTLKELTVSSAFFAALQVSLTSFLVVYLTEVLQRSLVAAGLALTVATVGGVAGRVAWGLVADAFIKPRVLLGLNGIAAGICAMAMAAYPIDGPAVPLLVLCAVFGVTAIGWNGVHLSELARHAPAGQAAAITGAAGFVGFSGVVLGPPFFGLLASLTGHYRVSFIVVGAMVLGCGAWLLSRQRVRER